MPHTKPCECEHKSHFESDSGHHKYGAHFAYDQIQATKTTWGTFWMCPSCRDHHHKEVK